MTRDTADWLPMLKQRVSFALAAMHLIIGAVPFVWALRLAHKASVRGDESMAWGVTNAMFVAPIWAVFVIAALVVDLRSPRTKAASIAALAFPLGCMAGVLVMR